MEPKVDFEWDDDHVMPEVVNPEVAFLFQRMIEVTYERVNPKPGELILDIGCGRGTDGIELARKGAKVIGLEPSKVMIGYAKEGIAEYDVDMQVVHGVGEYLPFKSGTFDKVMCKGALDHFLDPALVISQMAMVLKPGGEVVIAIANFESLGFKLGKRICRIKQKLGGAVMEGRMPWDIPEDHTYKLDYYNLRRMAGNYLNVKQATGVSLLFGLPWWGSFLTRCPGKVSSAILNMLDRVARLVPALSDVVVLRCCPKAEGQA